MVFKLKMILILIFVVVCAFGDTMNFNGFGRPWYTNVQTPPTRYSGQPRISLQNAIQSPQIQIIPPQIQITPPQIQPPSQIQMQSQTSISNIINLYRIQNQQLSNSNQILQNELNKANTETGQKKKKIEKNVFFFLVFFFFFWNFL